MEYTIVPSVYNALCLRSNLHSTRSNSLPLPLFASLDIVFGHSFATMKFALASILTLAVAAVASPIQELGRRADSNTIMEDIQTVRVYFSRKQSNLVSQVIRLLQIAQQSSALNTQANTINIVNAFFQGSVSLERLHNATTLTLSSQNIVNGLQQIITSGSKAM
jgi:hypothetical protein